MTADRMSTHTPGPWETMEIPGPQSDIVCQAETGQRVCEFPYGLTDGEDAANARLIAAAPDLLEALETYMSQFGQGLEAHGIPYGPAQVAADEMARAAIAKATQP